MTEPLVNKTYLLKKFSGKGGWTYTEIPEVLQNNQNPFGWVIVKGSIDHFQLSLFKLMPMGNGKLFLPVKAQIRKAIGKQAGDSVHVILYEDNTSIKIPQELIECFKYEPKSRFSTFEALGQSAQKAFLDWISDAKTEDTKAKRIDLMMQKLKYGLFHHESI